MVPGLLSLLEVCTCRVRMTVRVDRSKTLLAGELTQAYTMTGEVKIRSYRFRVPKIYDVAVL